MRIVLGIIVAAVLSAAPPAVGSRGAAGQTPAAIEGLALYATGEYARALAPVRTVEDMEAVYTALAAQGAGWIDAGRGDADVSRRRLVAASFALEAAAAGLTGPVEEKEDPRLAAIRQRLVAWGYAALTRREPAVPPVRPRTAPFSDIAVQPAESRWFLAAIALLEAAGWQGLIEEASPRTFPLIPLAMIRFPSEPRFLMAQAVAESHVGWPFQNDYGRPLRDIQPEEPMRIGSSGAHPKLLGTAVSRFEQLTYSATLGAEAHLRAGSIRLVLAERGEARQHFRDADRASGSTMTSVMGGTDTRTIRYLSRLFTGWAWDRDRRPREAEAAYRAALEIFPRARAASTRLAALLFLSDRRTEAASSMDAALDPVPPSGDPLTNFDLSEARFWPDVLAPLRAGLK